MDSGRRGTAERHLSRTVGLPMRRTELLTRDPRANLMVVPAQHLAKVGEGGIVKGQSVDTQNEFKKGSKVSLLLAEVTIDSASQQRSCLLYTSRCV